MKEDWKDIKGPKRHYQINSEGRVRHLNTDGTIKRFLKSWKNGNKFIYDLVFENDFGIEFRNCVTVESLMKQYFPSEDSKDESQ